MTVGSRYVIGSAAGALVVVALAILAVGSWIGDRSVKGLTVGEKLSALQAQRATLQAQAGAEARIALLPAFRIASQLADALAARAEADRERSFDEQAAARRQVFADLDALNNALRDALSRPGAGAAMAARAAADRAASALERLAGTDDLPLVLQFTPRFIAPRRATGELTLAPSAPGRPPPASAVRVPSAVDGSTAPAAPTVPRYVPSFAGASEQDPPVTVEIVGLHLAPAGAPPPVLTVGSWRGEAAVSPERLHFAVPRSAFATDAARTAFVSGSLALRGAANTVRFDLLFVVLPDRPGSFALDQRVRGSVTESRALVSPEILARGGAGEARTVRRCFDPPEGWRFDKVRRRILVVERLGWLGDIPDVTVNAGTVEFAGDEGPDQICVVVTARPAGKEARAATIGRFEVTLVRDRLEDRTVKSGVRALDWREAVRVPFAPGVTDWKLYLRLFDEIDQDFEGAPPKAVPFLRVTVEGEGDNRAVVLTADPAAEP